MLYAGKDDYMFIGDTDQVDNSQACDELDEVQARQLVQVLAKVQLKHILNLKLCFLFFSFR